MRTDRIEAFVNSLLKSDTHAKIQEFRFAPLEPGKVALVATADFSGREFYYWTLVISPAGSSYWYFEIQSVGPHYLPLEVVDLDGDGNYELIVRELVTGYKGVETHPIFWLSIFSVTGEKLIEVSERFPDFYRQTLLPQSLYIEKILGQLEPRPSERLEEQLAEVHFIQLKFRRKILGEKGAGLTEALEWSKSDSEILKVLAIQTFKEIEDPISGEALSTLSQSSNFYISQMAKQALAAKEERKK